MRQATEAEILQTIIDAAAYHKDETVRKHKCTFMAFSVAWMHFEPKSVVPILRHLINSGKVLSNLSEPGIHPFDAYLIPA
jgi:hypothetical protein